jgi:hypothetical protein
VRSSLDVLDPRIHVHVLPGISGGLVIDIERNVGLSTPPNSHSISYCEMQSWAGGCLHFDLRGSLNSVCTSAETTDGNLRVQESRVIRVVVEGCGRSLEADRGEVVREDFLDFVASRRNGGVYELRLATVVDEETVVGAWEG